jgi:DNA mismatch repair ATPase MutS
MLFSTNIKRLSALRQRWGHSRNESPHPLDAAYAEAKQTTAATPPHAAVGGGQTRHRLSAQTLSDIDFPALFSFLDHTTSRVGQQYLYHRLVNPCRDQKELQCLDNQANFFTQYPQKRERVQLLLQKLDHPDARYIPHLLANTGFPKVSWLNLARLDTFLVVVLLISALFYHSLLLWLWLPLGINLVIHLRNKNNTYRFLRSFPQLKQLIDTTKKLTAEDIPFDTTSIAESLGNLKNFQRKFKRLSFGQTGNNELEQLYYWVLELIKAFFLVEIHTFFGLIKAVERFPEDIDNLFRYTGGIDLSISIASLRAAGLPTCTPVFRSPAKNLRIRDGYHPLVPGCITNTLDIHDRGILITGSNMSGKSTFLRTIGVNALLAQTLYTCFATAYEAPMLRLYSSIRIDDNLLEGKSYYFEEVNVMGELIRAADDGQGLNLYLLDEVFRGTNTVERIAAARAILEYLNRQGHLVLVATHDIELSVSLAGQFELYHFEETFRDDQLCFDHQLKAGPLRTRNAIRLLELAGYPAEIIREANNNVSASR